MPMFEYVVGVTPPGGHNTKYLRGEIYRIGNDEVAAAREAIQPVSARYGFNWTQECSCVIYNPSEPDE